MTTRQPKNRYPRLHRNGTVSYWSYYGQEWIERAFFVPAEEIEAMDPYDQRRVRKHLGEEVEATPAKEAQGEEKLAAPPSSALVAGTEPRVDSE